MDRNCFTFDINRCVGCMACVAGCINENGSGAGMNWREVSGFNELRHPALPVFYFSLACNHCEDAPCMKNCPALAYSRDEATGAVIHHAEKCIGCKYCTWACPYDAPKFNSTKHIIEKCDFCASRIGQGQTTACAAACPTGALHFGKALSNGDEAPVKGFVQKGLKPSIRLIPLSNSRCQPVIWNDDAGFVDAPPAGENVLPPPSKISLQQEWTLVPFTLAVAWLIGLFAARLAPGTFLSPLTFLLTGMTAFVLSALHLGKKRRAWRALLNISGSWLSREIAGFSLFMGSGFIYLLTGWFPLALVAALSGILAVISVDMVYALTGRQDNLHVHSAQVWLTTLLAWSWYSGYQPLIIILISLKALFYITRKTNLLKMGIYFNRWVALLRVVSLILAVILIVTGNDSYNIIILLVLTAGEVIDRAEFYLESEVNTPALELRKLFRNFQDNMAG